MQARGLPTWLVELPSGDVHGLAATLRSACLCLGETRGAAVSVTPTSVRWRGVRYVRLRVRQREVRVGALAATLTLPPGRGPFPAVVMHGSGPQARDEFQVFAAYCTLLGVAVLADDKRGVGESGGIYPGEQATPSTIGVLARDAQAEARFLRTLPEIGSKRIGLLGDSQAGWVIALAAASERLVSWAVALAGLFTVTVGEADAWGELAGKGERPPSGAVPQMLVTARAARGGFDPLPFLRKLSIPVHWVFARDDRNVPTPLCIDRLRSIAAGHAFSWTTIDATHTLLELPSGLNAALATSRGFGRGLFTAVGRFLVRQKIVAG